jgi:hypothetical protein
MNRILDQFGKPTAPPPQTLGPNEHERRVRARFDTQFTTDENRRHFALADGMSVDASASWMVRRMLRMRNRYEYHNNSYYMGMADTIGNYVIGTGPRLQMMTGDKNKDDAIESLWNDWADEIDLAGTLHNSRVARIYNGEGFQLLRTNPGLDSPVKLDVFEIEADQVSSPLFGLYPANYPDQYFDGVVLDPWGRPKEYHVLRQHPGAMGAFVIMGYEFDPWPAKDVIHDFKRVRPFQQRGIPEANPALPLFAFLREYTLAVIGAAETAADFAAVAETTLPPDEDTTVAKPLSTVELRRRLMTFLPEGYKLSQIHAEQPTTTYDMFVNAILREICRCLNLPLMFASMDATQANMSSAYVITQPFAKSIQRDRQGYDRKMNRILDAFLTEVWHMQQNGEKILDFELPDVLKHKWLWDDIGEHADPAKVATAEQTKLSSGTTSRARAYARRGLDVEEEDLVAAANYGLTLADYRKRLADRAFAVKGEPGAPPPEEDDSADSKTAKPAKK